MILAHVINGPMDALIEFALPVGLFVALWWWSSRKERRKK
jgi:hypothetical protein